MEELSPEAMQIKDVCAHFGSAAYAASCLETGLAIALMQCDLLKSLKEKYDLDKKPLIREEFNAQFDAYMANQHRQVLGTLIKRFGVAFPSSINIQSLLFKANARRNSLMHDFWRDHAVTFNVAAGREKMIAELMEAETLFFEADSAVQSAIHPVFDTLGVDREKMEAQMEAIKQAALADKSNDPKSPPIAQGIDFKS